MLIIQAESVCPKPTVSALDGLRGAPRDWVLGGVGVGKPMPAGSLAGCFMQVDQFALFFGQYNYLSVT